MTKRKPPVPVKWAKILPHLPKRSNYLPMARPFATYGGALFVVGFKPERGGTLYSVMRYLSKTDELQPVNMTRTVGDVDHDIPALFSTSTAARQWAATESAREVANYGKKTAK